MYQEVSSEKQKSNTEIKQGAIKVLVTLKYNTKYSNVGNKKSLFLRGERITPIFSTCSNMTDMHSNRY